jgi:hypothetical protein
MPTTAELLIETAEKLGIQLVVMGERLLFQPPGSLPPAVRQELRQHKPAVIAALRLRGGSAGNGNTTPNIPAKVEVSLPLPDEATPTEACAGGSALDRARADLKAIQEWRSTGGLIGPPSPNLIVRGPALAARLVPAVAIPAAAVQYHLYGDLWREIPHHWRDWSKRKYRRAA